MPGIRHNYQAAGTNDSAKQVSVDRWNESHVIDSEIEIPVLASDPAPPADGYLNLYAKKFGGRTMLMQMGPTGLDTSFQPNLGGNKVALWMPPGSSTTVPGVFGMNALTTLGSVTSRALSTGSLFQRMTRLGFVSAATAGSLCGAREAFQKYTVGAGGGLGGFFARYRFGVSDAAVVAGARMFVGLSYSILAPTNVEPDTLVNSIGLIQKSTSNNLQMYCAGGAAGANLIDLGTNFPVNTLSADAYELTLFSPSSNGNVYWKVTRLNTGHTAEGVFTSGLPLGTQQLCHQIWRTNNATALAVGLDICGIYIETDN